MRRLVLGVDDSGRSCISSSGAIPASDLAGESTFTIRHIHAIDESPPAPVVKGLGRYRAGVLPPGHLDWYVIDHAPREEAESDQRPPDLHYRDVFDMIMVLKGSGRLILGDGVHAVRSGDCIVMAGTEHAFRPDHGGCRLMGLAIGTQVASD
jgi:mannose-6-phosphate isomerase-like protein (cupin superfamily)